VFAPRGHEAAAREGDPAEEPAATVASSAGTSKANARVTPKLALLS